VGHAVQRRRPTQAPLRGLLRGELKASCAVHPPLRRNPP
jgi:hypothetical protein